MPTRNVTILLVEDDEVDVMNVQRAFRKLNITSPLFVAGNGLEALSMLQGKGSQPPLVSAERLLILLDINMPKMNGIDFLKALRADPALKAIPVIVLSTSDQDRDLTEAYSLNVAGYLLKPVVFPNFVELMKTMNQYWTLCEMI
ncbi:MAG: response regulator [Thermosynechococcaceae cyanobacterium MS004]|nr:response regulator [Thermosynechococcaceae cyanobacterium MS004]